MKDPVGVPFAQKKLDWGSRRRAKNGAVLYVPRVCERKIREADGELFSWTAALICEGSYGVESFDVCG